MRSIVGLMVVLSGCDLFETKTPPADPPKPREFRYLFTAIPTNAPVGSIEAGTEILYAFHRRGFCNGTTPTGEMFIPARTSNAFAADVDDITVGVTLRRDGKVLARGCAHAKLFGTRKTDFDVPLSAEP